MLAKIYNGIVVEIIPDFDPTFPGVPIEDRFSPEFLKECVPCEETVQQRYTYSNGEFFEPVEPEPEPIETEAEESIEPELVEGEE